MNAEIFLLYIATWSLVALTPGPAVMCAMSQATRHGFRSAFTSIIGIQAGHLVFFGFVASGLATLLATASTAFVALRLLGAVYLLYLGVRILLSTFRSKATVREAAPAPPTRSLLLHGFAIQVTNPKALLFMSALLPQFIQPQHSLAWQLGVLLVATAAVDILVLCALAGACFRRAARAFRRSSACRRAPLISVPPNRALQRTEAGGGASSDLHV